MNSPHTNALAALGRDEDDGRTQVLRRAIAIGPGQYWRALRRLESGSDAGVLTDIEAGEVLLIQAIRDVDEQPHTIELRPHPHKIHQTYGNPHAFLLADFLAAFEYEPDAEALRASEIANHQGRINELQRRLIDPAAIDAGTRESLMSAPRLASSAAAEQATGEATRPAAQEDLTSDVGATLDIQSLRTAVETTSALAQTPVGDMLDSQSTPQRVQQMRLALNQHMAVATARAKYLEATSKDLAAAVSGLTPFFEERAAVALAQTQDVRTHLDKLRSGIESLDLYVGRDVTVTEIARGDSATADEPLTVVQAKLVMDEELSAWAPVGAHFDAQSQPQFEQALRQSPELRAQVFPTPRCVLAMCTTRRYIDYGNPFENAARNQTNHHVFLLARDGDNIFQIHSPVESHLKADLLFPSAETEEDVFTGIAGERIRFEDIAFTKHLAAHERQALHYKRFLILLAGLDHRLGLFGRFYPGDASLSFVSMAFQRQYMRFLHDAEAHSLIANDRGIPPLRTWQLGNRATLCAGAMVYVDWRRACTRISAPSIADDDDRLVVDFVQGDFSPSLVVQRDGQLYAHVQVKRRYRDTAPFNAAVCIKEVRTGCFVVLNHARASDLRHFITDRRTRRSHLTYMELFKHAFAWLDSRDQARAALWPHVRDALPPLAADGAASDSTPTQHFARACATWEIALRGRQPDLRGPAAPGHAVALRKLVDLTYWSSHGSAPLVAAVQHWAQTHDAQREILRISLDGQGRCIVYSAPSDAERDDRLEPFAWVRRRAFSPIARSRSGQRALLESLSNAVAAAAPDGDSADWCILRKHPAAEIALWESANVQNWTDRPSGFRSAESKAALMARCDAWRASLTPWLQMLGRLPRNAQTDRRAAELLDEWCLARREASNKLVSNPSLIVPIGLRLLSPRGEDTAPRLQVLLLKLESTVAALHHGASAENAQEQQQRLAREFIGLYADKDSGARQLQSALERAGQRDWSLTVGHSDSCAEIEKSAHSFLNLPNTTQLNRKSLFPCDPLLDAWVAKHWHNGSSGTSVAQTWLGKDAEHLDECLGNARPADYEPTTVLIVQDHVFPSGAASIQPLRHIAMLAHHADDSSIMRQRLDMMDALLNDPHWPTPLPPAVEDVRHQTRTEHHFGSRARALAFLHERSKQAGLAQASRFEPAKLDISDIYGQHTIEAWDLHAAACAEQDPSAQEPARERRHG